MGAGVSARRTRFARRVLFSIVALGLLHAWALEPLLGAAIAWSLPTRIAVTIASIAPLAFVMGMPLPLGMRALERHTPSALPWAWGVNGTLSVMGSVIAMIASVFYGVTLTLTAATCAYVLAAFSVRGARPQRVI